MSANDSLERKQRKAVAALLANTTAKDAARAAGISYSTMLRWLAEPAFRAALREAQAQELAHATALLAGDLTAAIGTLAEIHSDSEQPASVRVRAANSVLDYHLRYLDAYDLAQRVEDLEALLQQIQA